MLDPIISRICPVYKGMLGPIITSYKLTTCQLLYLTNTYKHREILLTIPYIRVGHPWLTQPYPGTTCFIQNWVPDKT